MSLSFPDTFPYLSRRSGRFTKKGIVVNSGSCRNQPTIKLRLTKHKHGYSINHKFNKALVGNRHDKSIAILKIKE